MSEINWSILQPVDVGAQVAQGFAAGQAMVKQIQTRNALRDYIAKPDDPAAYSALAYYDPQTADHLEARRANRIEMERKLAEQAATRAIGTQAATGDITGARTAALGAGQFDLADQIGKLGDDQRKKTTDFYSVATPLAFKLRQEPDPAKRRALYDAARPILEATGADAQKIASFDPTSDVALDAVIGTGQKIGDLINQGKIEWHQQGEQPSFATNFMGAPVGANNPYAKPGGPAAAPGAAPSGGFGSAWAFTLKHEGGYNPHDGNGAPVKYGINQGANPDVNVKDLTPEQAQQLAHDRYWVPSGAENLPPALQTMHFDTYYINPKAAGRILEQSGGDPQRYLALRDQWFKSIGGREKYGHAWDTRTADLAGGGAGPAAPTSGPAHIANDAEFHALPHGAQFIGPDGHLRRKP